MGDRQLAGSVVKGFLEGAPSQLHNLRARLDEADRPGARLQAHALKGAAATVSAEGLHAVALAIEQAGAAGQLDRCGELLPRASKDSNGIRLPWKGAIGLDDDRFLRRRPLLNRRGMDGRPRVYQLNPSSETPWARQHKVYVNRTFIAF